MLLLEARPIEPFMVPIARGRDWFATWFGPSSKDGLPPSGRDARIDMFRGLALVMIFINHVPGTLYENWTSRNFGFSDAAEAFVFISGLAAGLAYSARMRRGPVWLATLRVWARARHIYFIHLGITLLVLAIFAAGALWFNRPELLGRHGIPWFFQHPLQAMIGLPLLTFQLGYLNILPLYVVLLLATPFFLLAAHRWPLVLLGASIATWAIAGQFKLNFPSFPGGGGWFLDPFSWQLLFVIGLLCGVAMKDGRRFVPYNPLLVLASAAFVMFVLIWVKSPELGAAGRDVLAALGGLGFPDYVIWFEKPFLYLPRLLHALALFYLLASLGVVRIFAESRYALPLRLLGRHGLAIYATGTVLTLGLQAVKTGLEPDPLADGLMLGGGLGALVLLGYVLSRVRDANRALVLSVPTSDQ